MKQLTPVRLIKNSFYQQVKELESRSAPASEMQELLGKGRAKKGMFEGDMEEGELEIGQIASILTNIEPAADIVNSFVSGFTKARQRVLANSWAPAKP